MAKLTIEDRPTNHPARPFSLVCIILFAAHPFMLAVEVFLHNFTRNAINLCSQIASMF